MKIKTIIFSFLTVLVLVPVVQAQVQWQFAAPMPTARANVAAAVLDGQIYVIGGEDNSGTILDTVERFDPQANVWESVSPLGKERAGAAAAVFQGKLYVLGGHRLSSENNSRTVLKDVEIYDPVLDRWETASSLDEDRDGLAAVVLDGTFYAIGGADDSGSARASVESFDPDEDRWIEEEDDGIGWSLDIARVSFASVAVTGAAYTIGGFGSFSGPVSQTEKYESAVGTSDSSPFVSPRGGLSAAAIGNWVFVMGGRSQDDAVSAKVDIFQTADNVWTTSAPMNMARENQASVSLADIIYVFGGRDDRGDVLATVEQFGPVKVAVDKPELPADFALGSAYPNPFSQSTDIPIQISAQASSRFVTLVVYDVLGREIKKVIDGSFPVGTHEITWNGSDNSGRLVGQGTYLYRLTQGRYVSSKTIVLIR